MTTSKPRTRTVSFWLALVAVTALAVTVCLVAARWQWSRYVARSQQIERIEANYAAPPVPYRDLLGTNTFDAHDEWRSVLVSGEYVGQVVLRNRKVQGAPALRVLAVLRLTDGRLLIVDRGWLPPDDQGNVPAHTPPAPPGPVHLAVWLRPEEKPTSTGAPPGQVQAYHGPAVLAAAGLSGQTLPVYGIAHSPGQALTGYPPPSLDPMNHLSYTFQWYLFAGGAVVWAILHARRELRADAGIVVVKKPRRGVDEQFEDAL